MESRLVRQRTQCLESSLSVSFTSSRRSCWAPQNLTERSRFEILSALQAREAARNSVARFKAAIFDVLRAGTSTVPGNSQLAWMTDRQQWEAVRTLVSSDCSFHFVSLDMMRALDRLERGDTRLLTDAFLNVHEKRSGEIVFTFEAGRKRRRCTAAQVIGIAKTTDRFFTGVADALAHALRKGTQLATDSMIPAMSEVEK